MLNKNSTNPTFAALFLFIILLLLSDGALIFWLRTNNIALSPVMDIRATLPLLFFNIIPGLAALTTIIICRLTNYINFPFYKPRLIPLGFSYSLFIILGFIAAALSILFSLTDWDLDMIDFFQSFYIRFNHDTVSIAWRELTPHNWQLWIMMLIISPLYYFIPSLLETIGWQGFYYQLCRSKGFWFTSITSGLLWWLWQCPLILFGHPYSYNPLLGLLVGLGFGVTHQLILTWLRKTTDNLWVVALARATLSGAATFPLMLTSNYNRIWSHLHGIVGISVMIIFIALLVVFNLIKSPKDNELQLNSPHI